jgi:CDP-paratose 2-epimerase
MKMNKKVLITGGAGFVGSALGLGLAQRYPDWKITAIYKVFVNLYFVT